VLRIMSGMGGLAYSNWFSESAHNYKLTIFLLVIEFY
jgi:hypothetical protein